MKRVLSFVYSFSAVLLLTSCDENRDDNLIIKTLDGEWEMTQVVFKRPSKPDSVVTDQVQDLGVLVFDKCESKNSNADRCDGRRTLDNGEQFPFEYAADADGGRMGKTVTLAFLPPVDAKVDWTGVYDVVEIGEKIVLRRGGDDFEIHARR